ncbi:CAX-interacting protein 4 [Heracleum sosnowskyi]|uniref:CAX-interacting protein 4 n=1 Tax=Heracleum sosnowskyi TaxID=360622 RepID=A0AAD8GPG0_9APIA|nr:CAX-interacting protein 4 [Heracleum sosnowskyi]
MPGTAGRVRMPANNRVHRTHSIWKSAIGYDPYAPPPLQEENNKSSQPKPSNASFQDLLALARLTRYNVDESRGPCKMCGRLGHDKGPEAIQAAVMSALEKIKGGGKALLGKTVAEDSGEDSEDESESSDSDGYD